MKVTTHPTKLTVGRDAWVTVVLVDVTDFQTPEAAIAFDASGMAVKLIPEGKSAEVGKTLVTGDWDDNGKARGHYKLKLTGAELTSEGSLAVCVKCTATDQTIVLCEVQKPKSQAPLKGAHDGGLV